jgi:hypothetical protein
MSRIFSLFLLAAFLDMPVLAQRIPISLGDENFPAEALVRGASATLEQCAKLPGAVWARAPSGEAECIRYWASGLASGRNRRVLFYIPPDQLIFDSADPGYATRNPTTMQSLVNGMQQSAGVPFILISRPGILGSSGEHRQRRRELESRLMSAALDEIKRKHGIEQLALAGLSGGGHIVAALLGWRPDIVCAVAASSVSSPRMRWQAMGRADDLTGFADSYEPIENLGKATFHNALRVFVLGDLKDSNVPWQTQIPLAKRLKELGVKVEILNGEGSDPQRHALGVSARLIGSLCAKDVPSPRIQEIAAKGLKG